MISEEIFVDVPWGKMAVVCAGPATGKPVLLLHGLQDSAGTFMPLIRRLPIGPRFIMPELPGNGRSAPLPPGRPLHVHDYVSPLKMVIDHFKLENFTFIGHSMGAQIGLIFHAVYPGYIDRFISLDSLSYIPVDADRYSIWFKYVFETFYDLKNYQRFNSTPESGPKYTYEKALENVRKSRGLTEEAGREVLARCLIAAGDGTYRFCWDQRMKAMGLPTFSGEYQAQLFGRMSIPHLTVFCDQSIARRLPQLDDRQLEAHIASNPHYRLAVVAGNHDVHVNSPELVAPHVRDFLAGGDGDPQETKKIIEHFKNEFAKIKKARGPTSKL